MKMLVVTEISIPVRTVWKHGPAGGGGGGGGVLLGRGIETFKGSTISDRNGCDACILADDHLVII